MDIEKNSSSEWKSIKRFFLGQVSSETMRLKICLLTTFLLGLVAHGYGLTRLLIGHDSLHEFYWMVSKDWKISLGRYMEPILRYAMGEIIVLPWLTGLAGFLFVAMAAHIVCKMFSIKGVWANVLICGVMVTNVTVTALIATYIHDFAGDMFALLLAVVAAYAWYQMLNRFSWKYTAIGAVCLATSLGFYQAYVTVTVTLICISSVLDLLKGKSAKEILCALLRALLMGIASVCIYLVGVIVMMRVFDLSAAGDDGNNLSLVGQHLTYWKGLIRQCYYSYKEVFKDLFLVRWESTKGVHEKASLSVCLSNWALLLECSWTILVCIRKMKKRWPEILLVLVLLALIPVAMTCISIVSMHSHHLMRYSVFFFYTLILAVLQLNLGEQSTWKVILPTVLIGIVLMNNVQVANTAYEKKDLEQQATLSTMTRVLDRLEEYEGYVYGESEVAVMGVIQTHEEELKVGAIGGLTGMKYTSQITYYPNVEEYFSIVLKTPIHMSSEERMRELRQTEAFKAMGTFPAKDCIATIDGVIVVKLS